MARTSLLIFTSLVLTFAIPASADDDAGSHVKVGAAGVVDYDTKGGTSGGVVAGVNWRFEGRPGNSRGGFDVGGSIGGLSNGKVIGNAIIGVKLGNETHRFELHYDAIDATSSSM